MDKEEIIKKLCEYYTLKSELIEKSLSVPKDLEKEIARYELQFRVLTMRLPIYYETVDSNDKSFYKSLAKYTKKEFDEIMMIPVGDGGLCSAAIIKRGDKYGLFHISGGNPNWDDMQFLSVRSPFIYDDVRFASSFSFRNDIGLVAVKKDSLWGVVDMNREHCFQIIVGFEYSNFYDVPLKAEEALGMIIEGPWEEFHPKNRKE